MGSQIFHSTRSRLDHLFVLPYITASLSDIIHYLGQWVVRSLQDIILIYCHIHKATKAITESKLPDVFTLKTTWEVDFHHTIHHEQKEYKAKEHNITIVLLLSMCYYLDPQRFSLSQFTQLFLLSVFLAINMFTVYHLFLSFLCAQKPLIYFLPCGILD